MSDFTVKSIDEMRGGFGGGFKLARSELGVTFRPARDTLASVLEWLNTSNLITS